MNICKENKEAKSNLTRMQFNEAIEHQESTYFLQWNYIKTIANIHNQNINFIYANLNKNNPNPAKAKLHRKKTKQSNKM